MKDSQRVRAVVVAAALLAAATPSFAQSEADTAAVVNSPAAGRALTDYAPVLQSALDQTRDFTLDVYETVKRVHAETDLMGVFVETAEQVGGWDNKYLLFDRFLDVVTQRATAEIEQRWVDRLAGVDVFAEDHVRTALIYVRWDD